MSNPLTKTQKEALDYLYGGGDETIECQSAVWVKTRYKHQCVSPLHERLTPWFKAGTLMILERAKVEGQFGSCWTCAACVRAAIHEMNAH